MMEVRRRGGVRPAGRRREANETRGLRADGRREAPRGGPPPDRALLQEGWVIANHILVSFHVAFISSVLALPPTVETRADVLRFIFTSSETILSALFVFVTFHVAVALHEIGHFLVAARLHAVSEDIVAVVEPELRKPLLGRLPFLLRLFLLAPYGKAVGIKREGLNFYPDAPYNLAVAAAGPRASRNVARLVLPPAVALLAYGLLADAVPAIYMGRLLLGVGIVTLLDFLMADPGKYKEFKQREEAAQESAARVGEVSGWRKEAPRIKQRMISTRMQEATHPRLGIVTAPWQFRNCGMGGRHTEKEYPESNISMQEAMFLILGARDSQESQEMTVRLQNRLKEIIEKESGCRVMGIGLEGGLAPYVDRGDYPLPEIRLWAMMRQAITECGFAPGADVAIALDPAMSELEIAYREEFNVPDSVGMYLFWRDQAKTVLDRDGVQRIYERAIEEYEIPIISIEDAYSEDDHEGWKTLLANLGDVVFVIGDDLVTTNDRTIEEAANKGLINAVLVKANQIGTLYETLLAVLTTLGKGLEVVISHRSKSPNDDMEAHIALAANSLGLKAGGGSNTERLVKYHAVTMEMKDVETMRPAGAGPGFHDAVVGRLFAYEEPTNAGIPTVGAEVEITLPEANIQISFKGATPLGTSAGTGEAVHLVDKFTEVSEDREVITGHPELFTETEPGVFAFRASVTHEKIQGQGSELEELFARSLRYGGKGCLNAVANVHQIIAPYFVDRNVAEFRLRDIDHPLLQLEFETARRRGKVDADCGDEARIAVMQRKQNLGMNAVLSTSLALARGVAHVQGKKLYEFLREEMLAIVEALCTEHAIEIAGGKFADYMDALRAANRVVEAGGLTLYGELRRVTGIYDADHEATARPGRPARPVEDSAPAPAPPPAAPAAPPVAAAAPAPAPAKPGSEVPEVVLEGGVAGIDRHALSLPDVDPAELPRHPLLLQLSRDLYHVVLGDQSSERRAQALRRYLHLQTAIAPRTGRFEIVNDRVYRSGDRLLVPYCVGNVLLVHEVTEDLLVSLVERTVQPGTIYTDRTVLEGTNCTGEPIDLRGEDFDQYTMETVRIDRVRDMAGVLATLNASGNLREVIYYLRFVVAKLCGISFKGFIGAKNLQPEIHKLSRELSALLNGPFASRLRLPLRILVRNISGLVLRPKVIDELWNDTIDLSELHVRGSALSNELRRSAHHALGEGTLRLARAYLHYLRTGDPAELPYPGPDSVAEADERARTAEEPPAIVARIVANLEELLGTSQVVTRIREWQESYASALLRCESGNRLDQELELLVEQGIGTRNPWVFKRHLRILRKKSEDGVWAAEAGAALREELAVLEAMDPEGEGFDAAGAERTARQCCGEFIASLQEMQEEGLFRSIEGILAAYGHDSFAESFFQLGRFRNVIEEWGNRGAFFEQRHLLLQLDCLLEEMGFISLCRVSSSYEEDGVNLPRCLRIIHQCVANLEHDGLSSRELWDLATILIDERKTHAEVLDVLEGVQHTYHKLFQRVSVAYQMMAEHLGLAEQELRAVLANYQRYLHDLNTMVQFADLAKGHILHNVMDHTQRVDGEPAAPMPPEGAFDFLHLSHVDEIARLVDPHGPQVSLQDVYGGKGSSLIYISHLRLPTRDGFIIPTTLPRAGIHKSDQHGLRRELRRHVRMLESDIQAAGGTPVRLGDPQDPLLMAVRGGSVFTMPGMLATVVFVGMNDEVAAGLAETDPWYAYDAYRRFLGTYAAAAWGLDLEQFHLVDDVKRRYRVTFKGDLPPKAMKEVADESKAIIRSRGFGKELKRVLEDPFLQVVGSVNAVFESWSSRGARKYREVKGLAGNWHTAVVVQQMASGNRSNAEIRPGMPEEHASLTGVIPRSEMNNRGFRTCTGDIKFSACGDDLVAGLTTAASFRPVRDLQALMPMLARELVLVDATLRRYRGTDPEIEFTVEAGKLSILQARTAQTATDEHKRGFDDPGPRDAGGIGIRGGGFRGRAAFDEDDLERLRNQAAKGADAAMEDVDGLLLVLENPTPNEIPMILSADGLLTAKGGSTSHAAVAIHSIETKPFSAVLSVSQLRVNQAGHEAEVVDPDGNVLHRIRVGDIVSIHGESGSVFVGPRRLLPDVVAADPGRVPPAPGPVLAEPTV